MSSYYRQELDGRNYLAMIGLTYRWQNMENCTTPATVSSH